VRRRLRAHLPAKDKKITLGAFTDTWINSTLAASDRKWSTKTLYATLARKHIIRATLRAQPLDKLKPSHVESWKVELQTQGLSDSTIRSAFNALKAILDTAVRDEALARNVATAVTRPKVRPQEAAFLTPEEIRRVLEAARTSRYAPCSPSWSTRRFAAGKLSRCAGPMSTLTPAYCGYAARSLGLTVAWLSPSPRR